MVQDFVHPQYVQAFLRLVQPFRVAKFLSFAAWVWLLESRATAVSQISVFASPGPCATDLRQSSWGSNLRVDLDASLKGRAPFRSTE